MADGDEDVHDVPGNVFLSKRSKPSKRIIAARTFLKNISFDGKHKRFIHEDLSTNISPEDESSKEQDHFDDDKFLISTLPATGKVQLHHCISLACAGNIEKDLISQDSASFLKTEKYKDKGEEAVKALKSKSFITSSSVVSQERHLLKDLTRVKLIEPKHFLEKSVGCLQFKRTVLVTNNSLPFGSMSILPYRRTEQNHVSTKHLAKDKRLSTVNQQHNSPISIEGVEKAEGHRIVSYCHLLVPAEYSRKLHDSAENNEETTINSARDPMDTVNDLQYNPSLLDDPELTSGKHRKVLNLNSFTISIIQYARPSEIKKDINERFKEKFSSINITLSKLRSIKANMLEIGIKCGLERATIACAHVYFEKLVMKEKINKVNRKYCAGACLLLASKFMEDIKKGSKAASFVIETIVDRLRLHLRELLSCEVLVLIALEFTLCLPIEELQPAYKRIEANWTSNTHPGHSMKA